jgi:Raf kinase inhibitor-like YbhB/YbcL family protein
MILTSSAFENGETIPTKYTCEGDNVSPPLSWEGVPEDSKVLALVVDDPDASDIFTHWVIYNLPVKLSGLEENVSLSDRLSKGLREGINNFGNQGYSGPCPPRGNPPHRYRFRLFALSEELEFKGRVTRGQLMDAMEGKILEEAILMGRYGRR